MQDISFSLDGGEYIELCDLLKVTGVLTVEDVDAGESYFQAESITSAYGTLSIDEAGNWTYAANNGSSVIQALGEGQALTDTLKVTSAGGTASQVITVTINGSNDLPTLSGEVSGSVIEAGGVDNATAGTPSAGGTVSISDADAGQSSVWR